MVTMRFPNRARGFTLIEAIMVIVITGIVGSMVAVFIKTAIDGYMDSVRRAELTDAADVTLRRIEREIHLAVPNSVRLMSGGGFWYLEFVPTKDGGRYRNEGDGSNCSPPTTNCLCTGGAVNTTWDVLGPMPSVMAGDFVVVFNDPSLGHGPGCAVPSDVYCGGSRATTINNVSPLKVNVALANSTVICSYANNRFQVVDQSTRAVTYACPVDTGSPSDPLGNMTRYWNYGFNATQAAPSGGSSSLTAANAKCSVDYTPAALQRNGLLSIRLTLTSATGESVFAFREIHVDNTP